MDTLPGDIAGELRRHGIEPTPALLGKLTEYLMVPIPEHRDAMLRRKGLHRDGSLDAALVALGLRQGGSPGY